jgi:stage IV sporulation protein FB
LHLIKFLGIAFRFHPLFIMIMISSVVTGYFIELITLFGIVFVHEMGHVAAAKGFGWKIIDIRFLPFGGVATVDEQGKNSAWEEMIVAAAGPLQNGIMIGLTLMMQGLGFWDAEWGAYFIQANLFIGLFNLLPILPLDGGKIMQSLLSLWLNYYHVIVSCTWISLIISILVVGVSIVQFNTVGIQLNLLMVGLFLLFSNGYHLRNIPFLYIRFLMNREFRVKSMMARGIVAQPIIVRQTKYIGEIVRMLRRERYHLIYIINDQGVVQAVLPEQQIIHKYFTENSAKSAVSELFM